MEPIPKLNVKNLKSFQTEKPVTNNGTQRSASFKKQKRNNRQESGNSLRAQKGEVVKSDHNWGEVGGLRQGGGGFIVLVVSCQNDIGNGSEGRGRTGGRSETSKLCDQHPPSDQTGITGGQTGGLEHEHRKVLEQKKKTDVQATAQGVAQNVCC